MPMTPPPALSEGVSLFLDFDGTLVELAERPDAVVIGAELHDLLGALAIRLGGRLAIVSGRSVAQIDSMLPEFPGAVAGSHGVERRWADGTAHSPAAPDNLADAARAAAQFALGRTGVVVEEKSHGIAIHYRLAPGEEAAVHRFGARLAQESGLTVQLGKMMLELKAEGDKGQAIRALMAREPMAGTVPIFVGDDLTDEDGFEAVRELGGFGVLVGPGRETHARHGLPDVAAVHDWLGAAVDEEA